MIFIWQWWENSRSTAFVSRSANLFLAAFQDWVLHLPFHQPSTLSCCLCQMCQKWLNTHSHTPDLRDRAMEAKLVNVCMVCPHIPRASRFLWLHINSSYLKNGERGGGGGHSEQRGFWRWSQKLVRHSENSELTGTRHAYSDRSMGQCSGYRISLEFQRRKKWAEWSKMETFISIYPVIAKERLAIIRNLCKGNHRYLLLLIISAM